MIYGDEIHVGPAKARKNLQVHGISFETAREVFSDPNHVTKENYFIGDQGEQRYGIIGLTASVVLLLVVFVDRTEADIEIVRIISARKADDYERRAYEDQFR